MPSSEPSINRSWSARLDDPVTFEDRLREMTALLDAGLRISRDQSIPVTERLDEIGRLQVRIASHRAAAEFLIEVAGRIA